MLNEEAVIRVNEVCHHLGNFFSLNLYVRLYWNLEIKGVGFFPKAPAEVNQDRDLTKNSFFFKPCWILNMVN